MERKLIVAIFSRSFPLRIQKKKAVWYIIMMQLYNNCTLGPHSPGKDVATLSNLLVECIGIGSYEVLRH